MRKWIPLKEWREEVESRRNEALLAIKYLSRAIMSGEDLTDQRIGEQFVQIGHAIKECGVTDEMITEAVKEARQELGVKPDEDDVSEHFSNIIAWTGPLPLNHEDDMDVSPELRALSVKQADKVVGAHASAKKRAEA